MDTYESTFGVNQVDGYMFPSPALGATDVSGGALDGTTGTLTAAGLADFPELAGPIPFASCPAASDTICTYGYPATAGAAYTSIINNSGGYTLAGIYQHPSTDPQAGVAEMSLFFNYNSADTQWLLLAPGLINWVTQGTHLGQYRNYVEMDIDDTFTPDDAWDTTNHTIDYADGDSLRMTPQDVISAAEWSQANNFRLDQLFNYGSTVAAQAGDLDFAGTTVDSGVAGPDPLLAEFQATDPATNKPYGDDFGWISHTYDTPYLDVGLRHPELHRGRAEREHQQHRCSTGRHGRYRRARDHLEHQRFACIRLRGPPGVRARQPLRFRRPGTRQPRHRRRARPGLIDRGHRWFGVPARR